MEKLLHDAFTFVSKNTGPDGQLMIHDDAFTNGKRGIHASGLHIRRAVNEPFDPCIHARTCTHRTWLYGNIKGTFRQTPLGEPCGTAAEHEELCVGCGVVIFFAPVVVGCDDGAVTYENGSDGDLAFSGGPPGLGKGEAHKLRVSHETLLSGPNLFS